jgi:hypothetical protein
VATGTAPLSITSTTRVSNLNVARSGLTDNVAGFGAGQLLYQSATNTTSNVAVTATNNQTLAYNTATNTPYWTGTPNVGAATGTSLNVTANVNAVTMTVNGAATLSSDASAATVIGSGAGSTINVGSTTSLVRLMTHKVWISQTAPTGNTAGDVWITW